MATPEPEPDTLPTPSSSPSSSSQLPRFRVLFLGEGNFSFSHSISQFLFHPPSPSSSLQENPATRFLQLPFEYFNNAQLVQLVATSFDTRDQVVAKYGDGKVLLGNLDRIFNGQNKKSKVAREQDESRVQHQVNAWDLASIFKDEKFDRIVWNHPHLGTEDFRLHRCLLAHFFASASNQLNDGGKIIVSLLEGQDERWGITEQCVKGTRSNFGLEERKKFEEGEFPGYEPKRNKTGQSFKNEKTKKHTGSVMRSWSWCFAKGVRVDGATEEKPNESEQQQAMQHLDSPALTTQRFKPPQPQPTTPKPFQCPQCPRSYSSLRAQQSHTYQIHVLQVFGADWQPSPELKHECPDCGRKYGAESYLRQHRVNKHDKLTPGELVALFGDEQDSDRNKQEKDDAGYDYVPCQVCGLAVVEQSWGMQLHLENLKPVLGLEMQCPRCVSRKFIERRALFQHVKFCRLKYLGTEGVVGGNENGEAAKAAEEVERTANTDKEDRVKV